MRTIALIAAAALSGCVPVVVPLGIVGTGTPGTTQSQPVRENRAFATPFAAARAASNLPPLVADAGLTRAADVHARDMVENDFFRHTGSDASRPSGRASAQGVCHAMVAENIANGVTSEAQLVDLWMNSAGHRINMLSGSANSYGLGRAGDTWVLMIARRC